MLSTEKPLALAVKMIYGIFRPIKYFECCIEHTCKLDFISCCKEHVLGMSAVHTRHSQVLASASR